MNLVLLKLESSLIPGVVACRATEVVEEHVKISMNVLKDWQTVPKIRFVKIFRAPSTANVIGKSIAIRLVNSLSFRGYRKNNDGKCIDINECEENSFCAQDKQCANTDQGYTCF